jgi:subfamily B ATP-binding cassette protein HlyB/CyaB
LSNCPAASEVDSGLACLVLLLRFFNQPAEPERIRHQYGKTEGVFDRTDVLRCAKRQGLRAKLLATEYERLEKTPLPAVAILNDGRFVILAKAAPDRVLIQDPASPTPRLLSREEFAGLWAGELILMTHREAVAGGARPFDITWFIPAIVRYRRLFGEVLAASFFLQLMGLVSPLFFQVVIDKVLVHRGLTSLDVLIIGLIAVSLFEVGLGALRSYVFSHTTSRMDVELGAALFGHLLALPLAYFGARQAGTTVARVRELENIRNFLTGSALTVTVDLFFGVVFFAVMFYYSPLLTWIVAGTIPLYAALSLSITPILRRRLDEKFRLGAENQAFLVEAVTAVETLKAMAVEPQMQRRWENQLAAYVHAAFKAVNLNNIAGQVAQLISKGTTAACLWFGASLVMSGDLTIGQLVAFNMLAGRVAAPILRLAQLWQDFQQMRISVDRLGDILNTPTEHKRDQANSGLPSLSGQVEFEGVTFRYRPDRPEVLKRLSLEIKAGESIGIVGSSGSGKSTLTKLIQRLYVPESGRVLIDGVDLAMVDPNWLRRRIGVVLQENVLFNRSVRENIALADPSLSMEKVVAAAKLSAAHDFIIEMPEAYDTVLGERGASLSGGQRQRIAIARALVSDPRILIFDEATSALDYESERAIQRNMRGMCQGRTVFIIAHRLSAVRRCDRILTMEKGEIIEDGTHEELLLKGGRYAYLWRCQAEPENDLGDQAPPAFNHARELLS